MSKPRFEPTELMMAVHDVLRDYQILGDLIPTDEGGNILKLVNQKFEKIFYEVVCANPSGDPAIPVSPGLHSPE